MSQKKEAQRTLSVEDMKLLLKHWSSEDPEMKETVDSAIETIHGRMARNPDIQSNGDFIRHVFNELLMNQNFASMDDVWQALDEIKPPDTERTAPRFFRDDVDPDTLSDDDVHPQHLPEEPYEPNPEDDAYDPFMHGASANCRNLLKMASELESPDHEALIAAEHDPEVLEVVAAALVKAAAALRTAAEVVEFADQPLITEEKLEEMAAVAEAFEESGDELLQKQAGVLDEFIALLASPAARHLLKTSERAEDILYIDTFQESKAVKKAVEDIKDSPVYQTYRPLEQPLQSRSCPDHPGYGLYRIAEGEFQCSLDGKKYNWHTGFDTIKGNKVPGTDVQEQNVYDRQTVYAADSDTRAGRMGQI